MTKVIITTGVVVLIIIFISGFLIWKNSQKQQLSTAETQQDSQSLGAQISEKVINPLEEKLPETNPYQAETNPVKIVYPNPFE